MLTFWNPTSKIVSLELTVCYPKNFLFVFVYEYFCYNENSKVEIIFDEQIHFRTAIKAIRIHNTISNRY